MRILEEFWYGNIEPTEYCWKSWRNNRIAYHHSPSVNDDRRAISFCDLT